MSYYGPLTLTLRWVTRVQRSGSMSAFGGQYPQFYTTNAASFTSWRMKDVSKMAPETIWWLDLTDPNPLILRQMYRYATVNARKCNWTASRFFGGFPFFSCLWEHKIRRFLIVKVSVLFLLHVRHLQPSKFRLFHKIFSRWSVIIHTPGLLYRTIVYRTYIFCSTVFIFRYFACIFLGCAVNCQLSIAR